MTHEQFITLETAKLAKQAGFDWECWAYWLSDYANGELEQKAPFENRAVPYDYNTEPGARYRKGNMFSAPTQSVLQRWLREVKNIQLWAEFHNQRSNGEDGWIACYGFYSGTIVEIDYTSIYSTYEAALEAGLQECLTLLISEQTN